MSWTTPRTWVAGEIVTAGNLNTYLRDDVSWIARGQPAARGYSSAAITTTTSVAAAITCDSERFDNAGVHSTVSNTSKFTVPTGGGGKYICTGAISWSVSAGGTYRAAALEVNGTTRIGQINTAPSASHGSDATVCSVYALVAGDYVEMFGTQDCGTFLNINPVASYSPEVSVLWFRVWACEVVPGWAQYVISLAALFGAGAVLWGKVIKPLIRLASDHDELERTVQALERRVDALEQKDDG